MSRPISNSSGSGSAQRRTRTREPAVARGAECGVKAATKGVKAATSTVMRAISFVDVVDGWTAGAAVDDGGFLANH